MKKNILVIEELFTMKEVCEKWKVTDETVVRLIKKGHLEAIRMPGGWRFTAEALKAYTDSRKIIYPKKKKVTFL